jgi:hypothetical protein
MKTPVFEITVGNVGNVWSGNNYMQACAAFQRWANDSKTGLGRSGGESVVLWRNREPWREYSGSNGNED